MQVVGNAINKLPADVKDAFNVWERVEEELGRFVGGLGIAGGTSHRRSAAGESRSPHSIKPCSMDTGLQGQRLPPSAAALLLLPLPPLLRCQAFPSPHTASCAQTS